MGNFFSTETIVTVPDKNVMLKIVDRIVNLEDKIKKGELDQSVLFKEAQGLMGNSNLFNMGQQNDTGTAQAEPSEPTQSKHTQKKPTYRRKKKKKPVKSDKEILDETAKDMGI